MENGSRNIYSVFPNVGARKTQLLLAVQLVLAAKTQLLLETWRFLTRPAQLLLETHYRIKKCISAKKNSKNRNKLSVFE